MRVFQKTKGSPEKPFRRNQPPSSHATKAMVLVGLGAVLLGVILGLLFVPRFLHYSGVEFATKVDLDPKPEAGAVRVKAVEVEKPLVKFNATLENGTHTWMIDSLADNRSFDGFRFVDRDQTDSLTKGDEFIIPPSAGRGHYLLRIRWKADSSVVGYQNWTQ